jgi:AcrR family transcriptional regulator
MQRNKTRKEQILRTATDIFSRFGIKKSTMDEIAQKIRMGKSTLYHYFKNKEEIFLAVVKKEEETLKKRLTESVQNASTPQEKFRNYAKERMKCLNELSNYYATLTDAYLDIYSFSGDVRKDFEDFELTTLQKIFQEGKNAGIFDLPDSYLVARMIFVVFKGFEYLYFQKEITSETEKEIANTIEREIDNFIDLFYKGLEHR